MKVRNAGGGTKMLLIEKRFIFFPRLTLYLTVDMTRIQLKLLRSTRLFTIIMAGSIIPPHALEERKNILNVAGFEPG